MRFDNGVTVRTPLRVPVRCGDGVGGSERDCVTNKCVIERVIVCVEEKLMVGVTEIDVLVVYVPVTPCDLEASGRILDSDPMEMDSVDVLLLVSLVRPVREATVNNVAETDINPEIE